MQTVLTSRASVQTELDGFNDAAAQAGLQDALAVKAEKEQQLAAVRTAYDDLTLRLRKLDEQRLQLERSLDPLRERITALQLEAGRPAWRRPVSGAAPGGRGGPDPWPPASSKTASSCTACRPRSTASTARSRPWVPSTWRRSTS